MHAESLPVVIIGAGPVGLAAAAHVLSRNLTPLVFEAGTPWVPVFGVGDTSGCFLPGNSTWIRPRWTSSLAMGGQCPRKTGTPPAMNS
jgi:flavin-dependent dehydrogenase